jgi:periplasmic divalent cation tolerance protein
MDAKAVSVVMMTAPDAQVAERIVRALLNERLIACGNVVPGVTSIYRWEGEVQREAEVLVLMKTRAALVAELVDRASEMHPYLVPEVLALPAAGGLPAYCRWVLDETEPRPGGETDRMDEQDPRSAA